MLTSRQIVILKAIIDDFILNATPVGSKTLQANYHLPYSSATIRNEMAYLEEYGLLEKTHTSSGRIPSKAGYRYYVDNLTDNENDKGIEDAITKLFNDKRLAISDVIKKSCDLISEMTSYTSVALGNDAREEILKKIDVLPLSPNSLVIVIVTKSGRVESKIFNIEHGIDLDYLQKCSYVINSILVGNKLSNINEIIETRVRQMLQGELANYEELIDAFLKAFMKFTSDNIYVSGKNNMITLPDFDDIEKIRYFLKIIEDHDFFTMLANSDDFSVKIGSENEIVSSDNISVITSKYKVDDETGVIAIIGPTRMDYNKVIHLVNFVARKINEINQKSRGENSE